MSHQAVDPWSQTAGGSAVGPAPDPDTAQATPAAQVVKVPEVARPRLAGALAGALRSTSVPGRAVASAASALSADVELCDQLALLPAERRVVLRRAESEAIDKLGVGLAPGAAHRTDIADVTAGEPDAIRDGVIVVHGDGWSLVGRTPAVLVFLLDAAPGVVIDRSAAEGAGLLVSGLAAQLA